jgi:hypothetical protein
MDDMEDMGDRIPRSIKPLPFKEQTGATSRVTGSVVR